MDSGADAEEFHASAVLNEFSRNAGDTDRPAKVAPCLHALKSSLATFADNFGDLLDFSTRERL